MTTQNAPYYYDEYLDAIVDATTKGEVDALLVQFENPKRPAFGFKEQRRVAARFDEKYSHLRAVACAASFGVTIDPAR